VQRNDSENINIKMSKEMKEHLKSMAAANGLKVGPYVKMLIAKQLQSKGIFLGDGENNER
jgi:predicted DNA binding CopG/RHH family protein